MITILRGCSGCGKSTYIQEQRNAGTKFVVVSSDEIRKMLYGTSKLADTDTATVYDIMRLIISRVKMSNDVIIEATNLHDTSKLISIYRLEGEKVKVVDVNYKISFEQCVENVRKRTDNNDISEEDLLSMYNQWQEVLSREK